MAAESEPDLKLEIAHVLTLDVVGYSMLLIDQQSWLMETLNRIAQNTGRFRAASAEGQLTPLPTGDGMALVFYGDPEAPLECAMEISTALKATPEIRVRMGIHSGPVKKIRDVSGNTNLAGSGIDTAQRVMDCGDAGHILISKRVAEDLAAYPRWNPHLHDLGECEVKHGRKITIFNFHTDELGNAKLPGKLRKVRIARQPSDEVRLRQVSTRLMLGLLFAGFLGAIVAVSAVWISNTNTTIKAPLISPTPIPIPEKSVAVLPFENRSEEVANVYFADGVQDEILTRLSKIADLKVISRTSMQHYKSAPGNLSEIGRQLAVAYILEGSVQKSGEMVRINVQLIKATTDSHVWAETFDRKLTDIFSVESDIARAIADQLRAHLTGKEEQLISAKPTDNPEAYDAYLRGLAYTLKPGNTTANALGAQRYLREAVRLDPKFAVGWALLSYTDAVGYLTTGLQPTAALREEARRAAETAISLQPHLGEALLAQGQYHYACLKDYNTAVRYFQEALQFLPNSSRITESLAYVARRRGEWVQSESYFNEAERLDPRNANVFTEHALFYLALRRLPDAQRKCDQILDITPDDLDTIALQAGIAQAEGDLARASALLAPLRPAAADIGPLETQVYQAILERCPAGIIPRLKEALATSDPASGYFNGELRFWLGWAEELAGDHAAAEESWRKARDEMEFFLKEQPENDTLIGDLALTHMALGDKAMALDWAERAMAANPIEKDAIAGPRPIEILARVAAGVGESDRAIAALEKVLARPYAGATQNIPLTPQLLRLDPMFDPLRNDQRFQKLAARPSPK